MNKRLIPIGIDSFKKIIEKEAYFVDKSELITDILTREVILINRPRRFGKTLNLDMIRYFFDNGVSTCDEYEQRIKGKIEVNNKYLFKGLKIEQDEEIMKHQGKYPVIQISLKEIKESNWENCYEGIKKIISQIYMENEYLVEKMHEIEKETFEKIVKGTASKVEYEQALKNIMVYFHRHFKQKTILLIDEYDQPIIAGYVNGYYDKVIEFMRNMLSAALKTNEKLEKGILTGVARVAKESIFSGLNNPDIDSMLIPINDDKFGFSDEEVKEILKYYEKEDSYEAVKEWYNGYNLNRKQIYNPWSVLKYINDKENRLISYWVNTGSDELIKELLKSNLQKVINNLNKIIKGEEAIKVVNEAVNFNNLNTDENSIWSLMIQSGYLKVGNPEEIGKDPNGNGIIKVKLEIPNRELKGSYESMIETWVAETIGNLEIDEMLEELTQGKIEDFIESFSQLILENMSSYDATGKEAEKYYHVFCLGLFVKLKNKYYVKSELETGIGRSDVILIPKDNKKRGIILEFKKARYRKTIEEAAKEAINQIEEKKYETVLKEHGVEEIVKLGIGFKGKECYFEQN
ncbi:MAG: hypothetical protein A2Y24_05320 [Clostridiales bacterium GWE2_32_10]|nr:MAG: hypothetical protein A2Y24_05320 [Clostridiales bacterium GWE2_32_10]HBY21593.1 AAA family ATPase [Clostridiales bacterium]